MTAPAPRAPRRRLAGITNYGRAQVWSEALAFAREEVRSIVAVTVVLSCVVVTFYHFYSTREADFVLGGAVVGWLWFKFMVLFVASGLAHRLVGLWAEDAVHDQLRRRRHRSVVLGLIRGVRFERSDVDFVLVSPAYVLAIEVKRWGALNFATNSGAALWQANEGARQIGSLLRSRKMSVTAVRPVLALLGPARDGLDLPPEGRLHDDVLIVDGAETAWLAQFSRGLIGPDAAAQITVAVAEFADERDRYERKRLRQRLVHRFVRP